MTHNPRNGQVSGAEGATGSQSRLQGRVEEISRLLGRIEEAAGADSSLGSNTVNLVAEQVELARGGINRGTPSGREYAADSISLIKESCANNDTIVLLAHDVETLLDELRA